MKLLKATPSVFFMTTFVSGLIFTYILPWKLTLYTNETIVYLWGLMLLFASLLINTLAYGAFKKQHTPYAPFSHPKRLIKNGVFAVSRNPVYLALILSELAMACIFDSIWFVLGALMLFLLLHYGIVPKEEQILQRTFKEAYKQYQQKTRRWL